MTDYDASLPTSVWRPRKRSGRIVQLNLGKQKRGVILALLGEPSQHACILKCGGHGWLFRQRGADGVLIYAKDSSGLSLRSCVFASSR